MERLLERDASDKEGDCRRDWVISPLKLHVPGIISDADRCENIAQTYAGPLCIADGSAIPLHTRNFGTMMRSTIPAALQHGRDGHEFHLSQIFQGELARSLNQATHAKLPIGVGNS